MVSPRVVDTKLIDQRNDRAAKSRLIGLVTVITADGQAGLGNLTASANAKSQFLSVTEEQASVAV